MTQAGPITLVFLGTGINSRGSRQVTGVSGIEGLVDTWVVGVSFCGDEEAEKKESTNRKDKIDPWC